MDNRGSQPESLNIKHHGRRTENSLWVQTYHTRSHSTQTASDLTQSGYNTAANPDKLALSLQKKKKSTRFSTSQLIMCLQKKNTNTTVYPLMHRGPQYHITPVFASTCPETYHVWTRRRRAIKMPLETPGKDAACPTRPRDIEGIVSCGGHDEGPLMAPAGQAMLLGVEDADDKKAWVLVTPLEDDVIKEVADELRVLNSKGGESILR